MDRLTNEQRLQIIEFYYQNSCSVRNVHRALLPFYGRHSRPSEQSIRKIVTKFRTKFTLLDIKPPTRLRTVRSEGNIAAVSASVTEDREMSIRRRSQQLGLCYSTTRKILRKELGVKPIKLYGVSDGPPSLAVRMTFEALKIPFELVNVDYCASEHMTEEYAKMNPQKEIPVLDDNGFYLQESIAIMQYLCDKYAPQSPLYPKDPTARAVVNQRLYFNMAFYYSSIGAYVMAPIFFDYPRSPMGLKKVNNALEVFQTYLERSKTRYAAGDNITIADFPLVTSTLCLQAIDYDLSKYPLVQKWYETFKQEYPDLWAIAKTGLVEIAHFEKNPPDLSTMNHPFHPTRKVTK